MERNVVFANVPDLRYEPYLTSRADDDISQPQRTQGLTASGAQPTRAVHLASSPPIFWLRPWSLVNFNVM